MELMKNICVSGFISLFMVLGACVGIVGGSMVLCALSLGGLLLAGG